MKRSKESKEGCITVIITNKSFHGFNLGEIVVLTERIPGGIEEGYEAVSLSDKNKRWAVFLSETTCSK